MINTVANAIPLPHYQDRGSDRPIINGMGRTYVNPNMVGEQQMDFTDVQTVLYVLMNFGLSVILIVTVNSNLEGPCDATIKYWLLMFALVLAINSLIQVYGIGLVYKPVSQ